MTAQDTINKLSEAVAALTDITSGDIGNAAYEFGASDIERDLDLLGELIIDLKDNLDEYQAEQEE